MTYLDQDLASAVIQARVVAAREQRLASQAKKERRLARRLVRRQRPSLWTRWFAHHVDHVVPTPAPARATGRPHEELVA
jgi:hypothetical protein